MALNQPPRTIFITSFHGLVSRILESGFLDYLLETNNLRVVIFVPDFKCDYFLKTFGNKKGVVLNCTIPFFILDTCPALFTGFGR